MEIIELLTNHYVQIICQTSARCFTCTILLNHLKTHESYFIVSTGDGQELLMCVCYIPFSFIFLLPYVISTHEWRSLVGSIPGYFK